MTLLKKLMRSLRRIPLVARLDWKLYLLRDWWSTRVWTRASQAETPLGFKLATKAHPAYRLMQSGQFEPEETRILQHLFEESDVFVDIGANVGYYCCLALRHGKSVLAFEPQLQNLACLYHNLAANGWEDRVEVFPLALAAKPGLLPLFGASGPSASLVRDWAGYSPGFRQTVPVNTLDNILVGRFEDSRLVIKIDVEGAEYHVLRGAISTLSRTTRPTWLIEVCFTEYHPGGTNPDFLRTFQLFWDHGYHCYGADSQCTPIDATDVSRWITSGMRDLKTFNYVFAAPEAGFRLPRSSPASSSDG